MTFKQEEELTGLRGKEIIGRKGNHEVVYRILGNMIYLKGPATPQYYQMLAKFKQKDLIKENKVSKNWCMLELVDYIDPEYLSTDFVDQIITALKSMDFNVEVRTL